MKISLAWLRTLVAAELDATEVARRLTHAGFEVEARAPFGDFGGVVVAEVRGSAPHPNAAKLTLVDVWDGSAVVQVVCGAPNVPAAGALVAWARPGARLPSGLIAEKEVRGVVSPGMLCAEDELGLGTSHAGIIVMSARDGVAAGQDLAAALGLPDEIWDVNVTPNRPDGLGHVGIAREVAALIGAELRLPSGAAPPDHGTAAAKIVVEDVAGCARYTALELDGVLVGPSPLAARVRLQSLGVRAISNVVDATNWVLLESGQPLHAFDLDRLSGPAVVVRHARAGEALQTLDGVERSLEDSDLVICDAERPIAVAGVMGGATSEVSTETRRVLVESAYFAPARVRRMARRLALHSEASQRFERGVDPNGVVAASLRCAQLLGEWAGARVTAPLTDVYPQAIAPAVVTLRPARTRALLGAAVPDDDQVRLLRSIGLSITAADFLTATVPTWRPDLTREVDLIEEVARLHGYERVEPSFPALREPPPRQPQSVDESARDALAALGLDEVVTFGFVGPEWLRHLGDRAQDLMRAPIRVANPLREEQSIMRPTLLVGLLAAFAKNHARGVTDVRIFEVGTVFRSWEQKDPPVDERHHVAGLMHGAGDGWLQPGDKLDFYDLKGVVEELLRALGHSARFAAPSEALAWLHPGVQAEIQVGGRSIGRVGELHPVTARTLALDAAPLVFELSLDGLPAATPVLFAEPPRFPPAVRDLSFFVDQAVSAGAIRDTIETARDPLLADYRVLEDYREPGKVPAGHKGMLWSFTYRAADRTLTDAEVERAHEALRAQLQTVLGVTAR